MSNRKFVFDFDSTLTSVEGLDVLAEISLEGNPERAEIVKKIQEITDLGIDGDISFTDSLSRRIALLQANKSHLGELIKLLKGKLSASVAANKSFFEDYKDQIYVISCGFKEFIDPIVADLNITSDRVYANTFKFDEDGTNIRDPILRMLDSPSKAGGPSLAKSDITVSPPSCSNRRRPGLGGAVCRKAPRLLDPGRALDAPAPPGSVKWPA